MRCTSPTILGRLDVDDYALTFEPVLRCGIAATHAVVVTHGRHEGPAGDDHPHSHDHHAHRPYRDIRALLDAADLPARVRHRAQATFLALAEVEGAMHGMAADDVELHEVGSLDAIVDIVGACAALESLGIDRIVCSPIAVGLGTVRAAHGVLPNPAPATMALLARRGAPSRGVDDRLELATPTGVALMTALADEFGPLPAMTVEAVGYGAGGADVSGRPNVVQVVIGDLVCPSPTLPTAGSPCNCWRRTWMTPPARSSPTPSPRRWPPAPTTHGSRRS